MRPAAAIGALAFLFLALPDLSSTTWAAQSLIPTPYPSTVPGAAPLDPEPSRLGGPQKLLDDPYPQVTGEFSQGNPPIYRHHRHQRLVPSISQRKYRVDR